MPDNPSHDGLTAQGWNWSLSDAKTHVASNNRLNIGQMYITSDGKTRLYISMEEGRLNPELNLTFVEGGSFTVDWGDGTTPDIVSGAANTLGTIAHTYAAVGNYVITITVVSGKVSIVGDVYARILKKPAASSSSAENVVYNSCITKIELGRDIVFGERACIHCRGLRAISFPINIEMTGSQQVNDCASLRVLIIPSTWNALSMNMCRTCSSLEIVCIPKSVSALGSYVFNSCAALSEITIPDTTNVGAYSFNICTALRFMNIPNFPINEGTFVGCASLPYMEIKDDSTTINASAFNGCVGLGFIKFNSSTPPTVSNSNAFAGIPTDCIIYIPAGTLDDYEDATNYPDPDVYQYVEY